MGMSSWDYYGQRCSLPAVVVCYISTSLSLSNLVFKMGTMSPLAKARELSVGVRDRFGSQCAGRQYIQPAEGAHAKGCRWLTAARGRQVGQQVFLPHPAFPEGGNSRTRWT